MSKKVSELLDLLRESDIDPSAAVAGSEPAKQPGAEANRAVDAAETDALLDDEVQDLDEPMGDTLLPEADLMAASGTPLADPAPVVTAPTAGQGKGDLPTDAVVSGDDVADDLDPEIAEIIRLMGESEEEVEAPESEEKEEDEKDEDEKKAGEAEESQDEEAGYNDVDTASLTEEEVADVVAKANAVLKGDVEDGKVEDEEQLPGTDGMSDDQKCVLKRLFDESVQREVASRVTAAVRLAESKLNGKFQEISAAREAKINEQVSHYLEYVVETWRKENEPKLYTATQVKVAQKIFESVRTLVETFDIETVDASASLVKMYEQRIAKLESQSNKLVSENAALVKEVSLRDRALVIEEASKGLPLTEIENFKAVVAKIKAEDLDTFKENVNAMKASFTPKAKKSESIRATNETLALQGGIRNGAVYVRSEADLIANLIPTGSENNK
jgi:hypothetical protein